MTEEKYCYSLDGKNFSRALGIADTLAEAVDKIGEKKAIFFISRCSVEEFEPRLTADRALEEILDSLKDNKKHSISKMYQKNKKKI